MTKKFLILPLILFCVSVFSQEFIRYTTKQGLPSNHVYDIAEDAEGFMWFATNRGLVKFDGKAFKTLTIKDGLPNNDTWLLETDLQDRLWYFSKNTHQGFIKNDSVHKYTTQEHEVLSPRFTYKSKDSLWFHSASGLQSLQEGHLKSADVFNKKNYQEFVRKVDSLGKNFDFNLIYNPIVFNPAVKELVVIKQNKLLFFDWNFAFLKTTKQNLPKTYRNFKIDVVGLLYEHIAYYGLDTGILFINFKTRQSKYVPFEDIIGQNSVRHFRCRGLSNEIQVSVPGHLMIFDYHLQLKDTYSYPKELNRTSYKDSRGNVWLADFSAGISLIPNTEIQAKTYLKGKKVQKIESIDGTFFAGISPEGFYAMDIAQTRFVPKAIDPISTGIISQIKKDTQTKNNYFISARSTYQYKNNSFSPIVLQHVVGYNQYTQYAFKDLIYFNDKLYAITAQGIITHEENSNKILLNKEGISRVTIFKDKLFFGASDGLYFLENNRLQKPNYPSDLLHVSTTSFLAIDDYLLVGTGGRGIYLYKNNQVIHLTNTDGYSIQRMRLKDNTLWLATQNGVQILSIDNTALADSKIINAFYETDGLLQNNTNDIYLQDSLLYVASDIGLAKINTNNPAYRKKPTLYFKTKKDTLTFNIEERNNISVSFSTLSFINHKHLTYEYRLLPKQKDWSKTTTTTLIFDNLSPKKYTLEVKVKDQHHNEQVNRQYIHVQPAWWETILARVSFVIGFLLLLFIINKKVRKQIKDKERLRAEQKNRIVELELQSLRSQMNPHFVHNSLNAIQYYIQRNEVEISEDYLVKFSKLIRLFFEYSRRQSISIKEELSLLENYLKIEQLRFEEKLQFNIKIDSEIDEEEQLIPSMLLQPIVENAVNHGLFHKKGVGTVHIDFKYLNESSFQVIIEDDGIGINKAKKIFINSTKNYQSRSSAVLKERIELLNHSKNWHIDYSLNDKTDLDLQKFHLKEQTGTIAILTFKQTNNK